MVDQVEMHGRVVLITAAARGLGREVAGQLARCGATVIVSARDANAARRCADELAAAGDVRSLPVGLDVASDESVDHAARTLTGDPGRLDVLINNAAAYVDWTETASRADLTTARDVLEVNLFGAWRLTIALLTLLRQRPLPRIVNVSSGAGSHDDEFGLTRRGGQLRRQQSGAQRAHQHPRRRARTWPDPHQLGLPRTHRDLARRRTDGRPTGRSGRRLDPLGRDPSRRRTDRRVLSRRPPAQLVSAALGPPTAVPRSRP